MHLHLPAHLKGQLILKGLLIFPLVFTTPPPQVSPGSFFSFVSMVQLCLKEFIDGGLGVCFVSGGVLFLWNKVLLCNPNWPQT